uniref:PPUP7739 n=1 Tax=Poeciliopsis prolifica TaxID=188132 RepID=A0A0S7EUF3_9TELE
MDRRKQQPTSQPAHQETQICHAVAYTSSGNHCTWLRHSNRNMQLWYYFSFSACLVRRQNTHSGDKLWLQRLNDSCHVRLSHGGQRKTTGGDRWRLNSGLRCSCAKLKVQMCKTKAIGYYT